MMGRFLVIGASKTIRVCCQVGLVCILTGCWGANLPPKAAVSGSVRLDGAPLANGFIRFVPVGDTPGQKTSVAIVKGVFESDARYGPTVGEHRVEIESTDIGGLELDDEDAISRLRAEGKRRVKIVKVPSRYNDSSTLVANVSADDSNKFSFDLTTGRAR